MLVGQGCGNSKTFDFAPILCISSIFGTEALNPFVLVRIAVLGLFLRLLVVFGARDEENWSLLMHKMDTISLTYCLLVSAPAQAKSRSERLPSLLSFDTRYWMLSMLSPPGFPKQIIVVWTLQVFFKAVLLGYLRRQLFEGDST
jgi:hypothetical protein